MATWNYRVMRKNGYLGIHGVFYNEDGKPISCDIDPSSPLALDFNKLRVTLELMLKALDEPVLDYKEIEDESSKAE